METVMVFVTPETESFNAHASVISVPESFGRKGLFSDLFNLDVFAENTELALKKIETAITNACDFYGIPEYTIKRI